MYNLADDLVDRHVREGRGDRLAIVSEGRHVTYRELGGNVNRVAHALTALAVGAGDRVLLVLLDSPEFVAAFLGAVKIGAVAVPTNTTLRSTDYAYFLEESGAAAVIVHAALLGEVAPALEGSKPRLENRVVVVGDDVSGYRHWDNWLDGGSGALDAARTKGTDVAFWLWTSGSTGRPKAAVVRAHRRRPQAAEGPGPRLADADERDCRRPRRSPERRVMTTLRRLLSGVRALTRRRRDDADLDDELRAYLDAALFATRDRVGSATPRCRWCSCSSTSRRLRGSGSHLARSRSGWLADSS